MTMAPASIEGVGVLPGRYFSHMWFVDARERDRDWLAIIFRDPGGEWQLRYRHRYYRDDEHFDSTDEKSWYSAHCPAADGIEAVLVAATQAAADLVKTQQDGEVWRIAIESDKPEVVLALLQDKPWAAQRLERRPVPS